MMLLQIGTMMLTLLLVIHPLSLMESSPGFHSGFFFGSSWGKVSLSPASLLRRLHRPRRPQQPLHPQHPLRRHQRAPQHRQPLERTCSRTKDRPRRIASRAISSSGPNLDSKIYHFSGHKDYGHTKEGAYMCEKDALGQGIRAAKNEKHP